MYLDRGLPNADGVATIGGKPVGIGSTGGIGTGFGAGAFGGIGTSGVSGTSLLAD